MTSQQKVLLLVGSPKASQSSSDSLGTYLMEQMASKGLETEKIRIHPSVRSEEGLEKLFAACDSADILILTFPLYVDCLPAPVIKAFECVARHWKAAGERKKKMFLAICNSGFPESSQNETALAICRQFARETGLDWAGGLALGGGGAIGGQPLKSRGRMVKRVMTALDMTATALADGQPAPQKAVDLMAKGMFPSWLYTFMGDLGMKMSARKYGAQKRLRDKPYREGNAKAS